MTYNNKMKFYLRSLSLLSILLVLSEGVFAQGNSEGPGICFPPPCVPITDHIGWLIAALVGFGILKALQYSRKSTVSS
jgi:hypothetical protein